MLAETWGLLFRLLPGPVRPGLRRVGNPGPHSPVLVTANFSLTVYRLVRALEGVDAWLLVARSGGVNVWCAAGAGAFDADSVVSAVKTSRVAERVRHRELVLPPLAAPGVRAREVERRTGWRTRWGPVRAEDLPRFLERDGCTEPMRRVTFELRERLDAGLGSFFLFYVLLAPLVALLGLRTLAVYTVGVPVVGAMFLAALPWIPGRGWRKTLGVAFPILLAWLAARGGWLPAQTELPLLVALGTVLGVGTDLGGISPLHAAEFDPLLARLGVRAIGNTRFAGTVRTDLLRGRRELVFHPDRCVRCGACVTVCPLGLWERDETGAIRPPDPTRCTACCACLEQCPSRAVEAREPSPVGGAPAPGASRGRGEGNPGSEGRR